MGKITSFDSPFEVYTVSKVIGEGGAGRVYEVTNAVGEPFALKCLAPERISTERLKRFKNEIAFCQKNNHQNIIKVLDTGSVQINNIKCPFYVMSQFSGTLRTQMSNVKPDDALRVFSQILDGVEAAHLANVWHRDLKPENILWNERDGNIVVADFGIAHFEEEEIYTAVETKADARMANFLYSAPEQRMRGVTVDRRADIYSLGLLLNELFTKEVPQGAGFNRVSDTHPDYGYIDDLVDSMIQQNPNNRPPTIETIKKELIGRKNEFVALQQYDTLNKQVVPSSMPPEFKPLTLIDFDYAREVLTFKLNDNVPPGWAQEFRHPRNGYTSIVGYEPEKFHIQGDTIAIEARADEGFLKQLVEHTKNYVAAANRGYVQQQRENADRNEKNQRAALEKEVAEAEMRKNILANVKL